MSISDKYLKEKYGLRVTVKGAFSERAARKEQLEWWINREEELEVWKEIIKKSTALRKNFITFIIGDYGRGKTLSLLKIIDEAEKFKEIYPIYMNFLGEQKSKPGLDFIFRIFRSIDFKGLNEKEPEKKLREAIENIPSTHIEAKTVLFKIFFERKNQYQKKLFKNIKQARIKNKQEKSNLALFFLRGEIKPSPSQLSELGIIRRIESVDIAKEYLTVVLTFLNNLGYRTLFLAIDEFEYLFSLVPKSQHSIYLALLRGLYDFPTGFTANPEAVVNMVFFIAISEDGWNSLKEKEKSEKSIGGPTEPLLDRVDATTTLGVFDNSQTRELIIKRLKYNRIEGRFETQPLIPFDESFVKFIYEQTNGEPRAVIVRCGQVLDAGLSERISLLNKAYAQRVLEERGF